MSPFLYERGGVSLFCEKGGTTLIFQMRCVPFCLKLRCVPFLLARLNKASDYVMVLSTSHFASLKCVVQGFNLDSAPSVEPPPLAGLKDRSDSEVAEGD